MPVVLAVAFNCAPLSAVPYVIEAGLAQVTVAGTAAPASSSCRRNATSLLKSVALRETSRWAETASSKVPADPS